MIRKLLYVFIVVFILAACSPSETLQVVGIGVKPFKKDGKLHAQDIDKDLTDCYAQTISIVRGLKANPYRGSVKKGFIVAQGFDQSGGPRCVDSTEVAIFFTEIGPNKTHVEISSHNYTLSDFVADKVFSGLR